MTIRSMGVVAAMTVLAGCAACDCGRGTAVPAGCDASADEFARRPGETDDSARLQRLVEAVSPYGVAYVPAGVYELASPLAITNRASLMMHKSAVLRAVKPMDYVLKVDNAVQWGHRPGNRAEGRGVLPGDRVEDYNFFVVGGMLDGNGLASCMNLENYHHFNLRDVTFLNGLKFGLRLDDTGHGYELIADNCYFKTVIHGCKGNVAVCLTGSDSHFVDCVVVDYTTGFRICGGANRLTRCHVWGGPVREMLDDSVNYDIDGEANILRDCYADTGKTGFLVAGRAHRFNGCDYFANDVFKLNDITIVRQNGGDVLFSECKFSKNASSVKVYEGEGRITWRDMFYTGFGANDPLPANSSF